MLLLQDLIVLKKSIIFFFGLLREIIVFIFSFWAILVFMPDRWSSEYVW